MNRAIAKDPSPRSWSTLDVESCGCIPSLDDGVVTGLAANHNDQSQRANDDGWILRRDKSVLHSTTYEGPPGA